MEQYSLQSNGEKVEQEDCPGDQLQPVVVVRATQLP